MAKESRFVIEYVSPITGEITECHPMSVDSKDKCIETSRRKGIEIVSVKKLYPLFNISISQDFIFNHYITLIFQNI